jgi:uncharacterized protein
MPLAEYRILSLSGGGFLGLYTALLLQALEERVGVPLAQRFDLIAGTSVGSILAVALAYEVPMARMVQLFREIGPAVFSSRPLPSGAVSRLVDLGRSVLGPKYNGAALRQALRAELGARTLAQAPHAVVLTAVNVGSCRTKVFKTPHVPASAGDGELAAVDVAMASAAAPTYFPSVRVGGQLYADGGLFAVAPDQVALHEAEHFVGVDIDRVRMLALGTAAWGYRPASGGREGDGAVSWLADGRLAMTLIAAQQQHVQAMMEDRLGARYLRLDARWPVRGGLALDVATPSAAAELSLLARKTIDGLPEQQVLLRWIGRR